MPQLQVPSLARNRVEQVMCSLPLPLLLTRPDRHILYANPPAEALLAQGRLQQSSQRLMRLGQHDARSLETLLGLALTAGAAEAGLWFAPGLDTAWMHIRVPDADLLQAAEWPGQSLLVSVHVDRPELCQPGRLEALCRRCRLSRTERYVLLLLADGMSVAEVAAQLGLQISTLRTHVRHLLDKTGAASLLQLLRWLGSAMPLPDSGRA